MATRIETPRTYAFSDTFGSWGAALRAVTTRPAVRPYRHYNAPRVPAWSVDAIVDAVRRWDAEHGRPPSYQDWDPAMARRRGRGDGAEAFYRGRWPTRPSPRGAAGVGARCSPRPATPSAA